MRLPVTPANTLLRELRTQVRAQHSAGRLLIAVDALPAVDTAAFADAFAAILGEDGTAVFRAHVGDFQKPRARCRGAERSPQWFDEETFRRVLIDPYRNGAHTGSTTGFQLRAWDAAADAPVDAKWVSAPDDAVLVVDGPFLLTPSVGGIWHFSVWLEKPDTVYALREGRSLDAPYTPVEAAYLREQPVQRASVLLDVSDPQLPQRVYRDSC